MSKFDSFRIPFRMWLFLPLALAFLSMAAPRWQFIIRLFKIFLPSARTINSFSGKHKLHRCVEILTFYAVIHYDKKHFHSELHYCRETNDPNATFEEENNAKQLAFNKISKEMGNSSINAQDG